MNEVSKIKCDKCKGNSVVFYEDEVEKLCEKCFDEDVRKLKVRGFWKVILFAVLAIFISSFIITIFIVFDNEIRSFLLSVKSDFLSTFLALPYFSQIFAKVILCISGVVLFILMFSYLIGSAKRF